MIGQTTVLRLTCLVRIKTRIHHMLFQVFRNKMWAFSKLFSRHHHFHASQWAFTLEQSGTHFIWEGMEARIFPHSFGSGGIHIQLCDQMKLPGNCHATRSLLVWGAVAWNKQTGEERNKKHDSLIVLDRNWKSWRFKPSWLGQLAHGWWVTMVIYCLQTRYQ